MSLRNWRHQVHQIEGHYVVYLKELLKTYSKILVNYF